MLALIKSLFGNSTTPSDAILNMYLDLAEQAIAKHINKSTWTEEDTAAYTNQIVLYAKYLYDNRKNINVASQSQGARSKSYNTKNIGIPAEIKALLPTPYVRVVG